MIIFGLLYENNFTEIKKLVDEQKVDLLQRNQYGNTPLHEACATEGNVGFEIVKLILNSDLAYEIEAAGIDEFTPLQYAVSSGNNDTVKILLEHGASVNQPDNSGATPIMNAVARYEYDDEIIKTLLGNGADPNRPNHDGITLFDLLDMPKNKAIKPLFNKFKE